MPADHAPALGPAAGLRAAEEVAGGRILVIDDSVANCSVLKRVLERDGHVVATVSDARQALSTIERDRPELILLDVVMPRVSGFELCRKVKTDRSTRLIPVVLITGLDHREDRIVGIRAGADDFLRKPIDVGELTARVRALLALKRYTDQLESAETMLIALARMIEARDPCTGGHCERLARYAVALGSELRLESTDLTALERGGILHDIGKVAIPDAILQKPGPLTPAEYALIQRHTIIGDELCAHLPSLQGVRPIVRHHHELYDGSGYPDHLVGDDIPLIAQILGIVDVFDALTTDRPYRRAWPFQDACKVLCTDAAEGRRRRDLVKVFIAIAGNLCTSSF